MTVASTSGSVTGHPVSINAAHKTIIDQAVESKIATVLGEINADQIQANLQRKCCRGCVLISR